MNMLRRVATEPSVVPYPNRVQKKAPILSQMAKSGIRERTRTPIRAIPRQVSKAKGQRFLPNAKKMKPKEGKAKERRPPLDPVSKTKARPIKAPIK